MHGGWMSCVKIVSWLQRIRSPQLPGCEVRFLPHNDEGRLAYHAVPYGGCLVYPTSWSRGFQLRVHRLRSKDGSQEHQHDD